MKKITSFTVILMTFATLAGCQKNTIATEDSNNGGIPLVLYATQENARTTRTHINATDSKIINWSDNDCISVFDGTANHEFSIVSGAGEVSATFQGEVSVVPSAYTALYPYQKDAVLNADASISGVTLSSNQVATEGSFDPKAALMLAKSESTELIYRNVVGFVKLTPEFDCTKITLENKGTAALAGTVKLSMSESNPKLLEVTDPSSSVCIEGDIKAGTTYYIALCPTSFTDGFKLIFTAASGEEKYRESAAGNTLEVKRGQVMNLGQIKDSDLTTVGPTVPYVTFSAEDAQSFNMTVATSLQGRFEYSVGYGAWTEVSSGTAVSFGGAGKDLRLRGKSAEGTALSTSDFSKINFANSPVVSASGDIRTLIDYENYASVNTASARFCSLFLNSMALVSAPELPATTLADNCYHSMFRGCSALANAPVLPAIILAQYCYNGMFWGCTALTSTPVLPATTLAQYCYSSMFRGCTALMNVTELPASSLTLACYMSMFNGCTGLKNAPVLPATTLADYCYYSMFSGCTSLKSAPALPANTLKSSCYNSMFSDCTSLTTAPALNAPILTDDCYKEMFKGCTSLNSAPELPAMTLAKACYACMFSGCTNLKTAPSLPATKLVNNCYAQMFHSCSNLLNAPQIDATELAKYCCLWMFANCKALTIGPDLKAETLVSNCYQAMFEGCSNLTEVTIYATGAKASIELCLMDWLDITDYNPGYPGYSGYPGYPGSGTESSGTIYYRKGVITLPDEVIPSGWTCKDISEKPTR